MKENTEINIVYTMDDNFAMQAGVSLVSMFENNQQFLFHVYILSDNIQDSNKEKLVSLVKRYDNLIDIIEMPDVEQISGVSLSICEYPRSAYARLFLCELLPDHIDTLLYLDPDTIITSGIDYLVEVMNSKEFKEVCAAACIDSISYFKRLCGFKRAEKYYNSGVMLINLSYWRKKEIQALFIDEVKRREGKSIGDADQSFINSILIKRIMTLPAKYNVMSFYYSEYYVFLKKSGLSAEETYPKNEIKEAVKNPVIIHFAGNNENRPWYVNCNHSRKDDWMNYLSMSEWKDFVPVEKAPAGDYSFIVKFRKKIVRYMIKKNILFAKLYTKFKYGFEIKLYRN